MVAKALSFNSKAGKAKAFSWHVLAFKSIIGIVFLCFLLFPVNINKANIFYNNDLSVKTVVIDAGHGGHDSGCLGHSRVNEKVVALNIALLLGKYIEANIPDVKVVYTRKSDVFVELEERAAIANRNNADLFISIHCNAASPSAYGTETFIMAPKNTDGNLKVAMRENSVIELEENYQERYQFDPSAPETYIMMTLTQNAYLEQSTNFAAKVQDQFRERVGRRDRGVKAASLWVLWRTAAPAVLIETGFLTNAAEEKFLNSRQGQEYIASAIFRAFRDYKGEVEQVAKVLEHSTEVDQEAIVEEAPVEIDEEELISEAIDAATNYRVQLLVSSRKYDGGSKKFRGIDHLIIENTNNGLYRYSSGPFDTEFDAKSAQKKVRSDGFPDAFITIYQGNERVSILNQ